MPVHNILITAGSGHIGQELVPQLLATRKARVILPTRNPHRMRSSLGSRAKESSVVIEEGSVRDADFVESIIVKHQVDTVFLCLTGTDELMTTLNFLDAMERAGSMVKHLVYLSACGDYVSQHGVANLMKTCSAAHILVKSTLEQKLIYGGFPWTITTIGPTLFFSNDLRSKGYMLEHGLFDEPLGDTGVSRASTSDIARAITNVIVDPSNKGRGRKVMVGSLKQYTGSEITALWGEAVGKPIKMASPDQSFEETFNGKMGRVGEDSKAWARDLRLMYITLGLEAGFGMTEEDYRLQVDVLGKAPKDYAEWVKATGSSWRK